MQLIDWSGQKGSPLPLFHPVCPWTSNSSLSLLGIFPWAFQKSFGFYDLKHQLAAHSCGLASVRYFVYHQSTECWEWRNTNKYWHRRFRKDYRSRLQKAYGGCCTSCSHGSHLIFFQKQDIAVHLVIWILSRWYKYSRYLLLFPGTTKQFIEQSISWMLISVCFWSSSSQLTHTFQKYFACSPCNSICAHCNVINYLPGYATLFLNIFIKMGP